MSIGAGSCVTAYNTYLNRYNQRMSQVGGISTVDISGTYSFVPTGGDPAMEIHATATFEQVEPADLSNLRASILVYQDNIDLGNGVLWQHVVRRIVDQNITLSGIGDNAVVETVIQVVEDEFPHFNWVIDELHLVAYLQSTATREIFQSVRMEEETSAGVEHGAFGGGLRIVYARPNPFRPLTRIGFSLADGVKGDLSVHDLSGRRVATLFRGTGSGGMLEAVWSGQDDAGSQLASGVYFVRLASEGQPAQAQKIIRLE